MSAVSEIYNNAVFFIEVDRIKPNPFQPRREFNDDRLRDLADSIRQYGVLQPLVVTRKEIEREDGSIFSEYELIAGERRWRASQIAGLAQVPAIIKAGEHTDKIKLELAIIENLQREDLNPVDRARAFHQLVNEFNLKHIEVAKRVGKSREFVSNSLRILMLPQEMIDTLVAGQISEGHTRPLLMLSDRPEEQMTLFREILAKRLSVRDTESISRRIAYDKVRKRGTFPEPELLEIEERLTEKFGGRVRVEKKPVGGKITIDFFNKSELERALQLLTDSSKSEAITAEQIIAASNEVEVDSPIENPVVDDGAEDELYFIKNFCL